MLLEPLGLWKVCPTVLTTYSIGKQLSFQWKQYAHSGKDKGVSRSGVSAPSGTNSMAFKRPQQETNRNWFQLYSWFNAWLYWWVTQWRTCPLRLANHLENIGPCEYPVTLYEYRPTVTLFLKSKQRSSLKNRITAWWPISSILLSDDPLVEAKHHLLK